MLENLWITARVTAWDRTFTINKCDCLFGHNFFILHQCAKVSKSKGKPSRGSNLLLYPSIKDEDDSSLVQNSLLETFLLFLVSLFSLLLLLSVGAFGLQPALGLPERDRVIYPLLDVRHQGNITPLLPLDPLLLRQSGHAISPGGLHDLTGNNQASLAHTINTGVDEARVDLVGCQRLGEGVGTSVHHLVGYTSGFGQDGTQAKTREHVNVVALVRVVGDGASGVGAGLDS